MNRRTFVISSLKAACITYASTYISSTAAGTLHRSSLSNTDKTLMAFVDTVIPGCDANDLNLIAGFYDTTLPMAKYLRVFTYRIWRNTKQLGFKKKFRQLNQEEKMLVIEYAYNKGGIDRELFHAGIYLSQVSVYCGVFNSTTSSSYIDFTGPQLSTVDKDTWHYKEMENLEIAKTKDGNHP